MYYNNWNRIQPAVGSTYDISLEADGFAAQGVGLGRKFAWELGDSVRMAVGIGASVLKGKRTRMGRANGGAYSVLNGYNYSVNLYDADSSKTFLYMPQGETIGQGYAIDCGLTLKWQDGKQLDVVINDVMGEIVWRDLPASRIWVSSATASRDADGYTIFDPTLMGVNSRGKIIQKLNPKVRIQYGAPITANVTATISSEWMRGYFFPRLGMSYRSSPLLGLTLDFDSRFKSIGFGTRWRDIYLNARTQSLNFDQSRARGVELGWRFVF